MDSLLSRIVFCPTDPTAPDSVESRPLHSMHYRWLSMCNAGQCNIPNNPGTIRGRERETALVNCSERMYLCCAEIAILRECNTILTNPKLPNPLYAHNQNYAINEISPPFFYMAYTNPTNGTATSLRMVHKEMVRMSDEGWWPGWPMLKWMYCMYLADSWWWNCIAASTRSTSIHLLVPWISSFYTFTYNVPTPPSPVHPKLYIFAASSVPGFLFKLPGTAIERWWWSIGEL